MGVLILKFICPVIVLSLAYLWNWRIKVKKRKRLSEAYYELEDVNENIVESLKNFPQLISQLGTLEGARVCKVIFEEKIIAIILYSKSPQDPYSCIHYIEVLKKYRKFGYLRKLIDLVILDTEGMSFGVKIKVEDPSLKRIFINKFGFRDYKNYLLFSYGNRS